MKKINTYSSDIAFSASVKEIQILKKSRNVYAKMEESGSWETIISSDLKKFIEAQTTAFLGTANLEGQPYIQHRGGPAGFLRVLDDRTIGFIDFKGNRQFISTGNLAENPKAQLFLIDYVHQRRFKIWGEARVVECNESLFSQLTNKNFNAPAEQVILFNVSAWDVNCPKYINRRFEASDVNEAILARDSRIQELELEIKKLRSSIA
jgi:hypothetical protein